MEMSVSVKVEGDRVVVQHNPEPKKHIVVCGAGMNTILSIRVSLQGAENEQNDGSLS